MYKLIATDLDNTFLKSDKSIPEENRQAIKLLSEKGVYITLCSGRSSMSLQNFARRLSLNNKDNYFIAFNGSRIFNTFTKDVVYDRLFNKDLAKIIVEHANNHPIDCLVYYNDELYVQEINEAVKVYARISELKLNKVDSLTDFLKNDISKIILKAPNKILLDFRDEMKKLPEFKDINIFFSDSYLLEFTHSGVDKGSGMMKLCEILDIKREEVIAIGDSYNDIPMIKEAGMGIVVNNADDEIKKYADYVTQKTNNDGVLMEIYEKFF